MNKTGKITPFQVAIAIFLCSIMVGALASKALSSNNIKKAENWRRVNWVDEKGKLHTTILSPRPGEEAPPTGASARETEPPSNIAPTRKPSLPTFMSGKVEKVISADTFLFEGGRTVKYVGLRAPQKGDPGYQQALEYHRKTVQGKYVNILFDTVQVEDDGTLLGLVFINQMTFVNADLIRNGYARANPTPPNLKYERLFNNLEERARTRKKGIWKE